MRDITRPVVLYLKAGLFFCTGLLSAALLLLQSPRLTTAFLLVIAVWSFARLYYFAFYVLERYVDPSCRFSGLWSVVTYLLSRPDRKSVTE